MIALLAGGDGALAAARRAAERARVVHQLASVELQAPVLRPGKLLCIGLNYSDHARETGREPPKFPTVFCKQATCVNRPGGAILVPPESDQVDYEGELAFVIGRRCRRVRRADAKAVIAGYTIVNDVTVRDWQARSPTFTLGKGWDGHAPMGPALVTADEVGDPHALRLRTLVNGEVRQEASTAELIFDLYNLVETVSTAMTLEPGDLISTGTPSGVGVAMKPPRFLRPGDVVRIEIEKLGVLENPVVAEGR
jgi:2-keto-4-pentenoate hydratase/2-oxohepta-3-ene-1,7-dioic acid hydratase in catechol pathway